MQSRPEPPFGRVLTAIITPFTADGSVDYATFWRLVRYLGANGSDGIVVAGTTGESPTLSRPEKVALFKSAVDASGDSMTVVAGVGTYDTRESVELAESAASCGVDGVMAVTPYYSKPPQRGIAAHMTAIADATDRPMMVYNIPGRSATIIEVDTMVELAQHPLIGSMKDAVDDIEWSKKCLEALPDGFAVYSGSDGMTKDLMDAGAVGVVSVTAHLAGREIAAMVNAVIDGDDRKATQLHDLIDPLNDALFAEPSPMPLKAGLTRYWDFVGEPRLPLVAATEATTATVGTALDSISEYRTS
jgi:4-hydroxy-tetrahydrodipicolinate synthase